MKCTCPVVTIRCKSGQVSEVEQKRIADDLCAMVELIVDENMSCGRTVFGKHRTECECNPLRNSGVKK